MAWTNPITWVFKQVWSATVFNQQIRDNLLFLKNRPYTVAALGSTNQTGISTAWTTITNSGLQIVVPVTAVLEFGWRITLSHTTVNNYVSIDIYDLDNNVYLSSGTATPSTAGLARLTLGLATGASIFSGSFLHVNVPAGTHNYEFRLIAQAASSTINNSAARNETWVKEVA